MSQAWKAFSSAIYFNNDAYMSVLNIFGIKFTTYPQLLNFLDATKMFSHIS